MNLATRNAATGILLSLNVLFFAVWIATLFLAGAHPNLTVAADKLYGVFMGVNNALMLILNTEAKRDPANPTEPVDPASRT